MKTNIRKLGFIIIILFAFFGCSDNAETHIQRGLEYAKKGLHDMAIKEYSESILLEPTNGMAYILRGHRYSDKGQYDMAMEDYNWGISRLGSVESTVDYPAGTNLFKATAYQSRGLSQIQWFKNYKKGCSDLKDACALGLCEGYEEVKKYGYCK